MNKILIIPQEFKDPINYVIMMENQPAIHRRIEQLENLVNQLIDDFNARNTNNRQPQHSESADVQPGNEVNVAAASQTLGYALPNVGQSPVANLGIGAASPAITSAGLGPVPGGAGKPAVL